MISFLQDQHLAMSCNATYACVSPSYHRASCWDEVLMVQFVKPSHWLVTVLFKRARTLLYCTPISTVLVGHRSSASMLWAQKRSTACESASLTTCGRIKKGRWGGRGGGGGGLTCRIGVIWRCTNYLHCQNLKITHTDPLQTVCCPWCCQKVQHICIEMCIVKSVSVAHTSIRDSKVWTTFHQYRHRKISKFWLVKFRERFF